MRAESTETVDDEAVEDGLARMTERGRPCRRWLAGRTVAVVGLARSGVAAARLVRALGGRVLASDASPAERLSPEARALAAAGCAMWTGGHPGEAFAGAGLVVVSPGVPLDLPPLEAARGRGVPVLSELELAWRVMEADFVAITGTNGKTTTTALTGDLLRRQRRPVLVGGNIGTPLSVAALDFASDGIVVAETSSFQLEATERFRPRVAAVLNLTPDHLDRHGSFARYREAKVRILVNQTGEDWAILNADDAEVAALAPRARGRVMWFSRRRALDEGVCLRDDAIVARLDGGEQIICRRADIPLRGQHNVENVLAATACALWAGLPAAEIRAGIAGFAGVAHRIERVLEVDGVTYINDSKGTNVASTLRALESFDEPLILIAGGKGKGQDFAPLAAAARGRVKHAVLIGEDGPAIGAVLAAAGIPTEPAPSMAAAVAAAATVARPGDVVLLSPACASFDMFDNFEHRGDVFRAVVRTRFGDGGR